MTNQKKKVTYKAVIGLGFGDEGKGMVTGYLCSKDPENTINIRYSGGPQAAHRVISTNGSEHVHSHFGSGSLYGVPTYWSKYCAFEFTSFQEEYHALAKLLEIEPNILIDGKCPIITTYDIAFDQWDILRRKNGTCGFGVGITFEREENNVSLLFEDLFNEAIFNIKTKLVKEYYEHKTKMVFSGDYGTLIQSKREEFLKDVYYIKPSYGIPQHFLNIIFEGSQGLLLDQNYGFFPYVTRANTGSTNILKMGYEPEIYLVTRAYQTRHGNGPMTNENLSLDIKLPKSEKNVTNRYQGNFRTSILDLNLLKYTIEKDSYIKKDSTKKTLVITCLDHCNNGYSFTIDGIQLNFNSTRDYIEAIVNYLKISDVLLSSDEYSENLIEMNR